MEELRQKSETKQKVELVIDLTVTLIFCVFWIWFAYQYGFRNSPDSWYRGVLGKSIAEGHPYYINLKQGYLYEFGIWHHDATHEPFLPFLYAIFFKFFGNKIIIANIISSLSAGLLIFPLLRLSRKLFESPFPAFLVFVFLVFNAKINYLMEVFAGLSIPTSLLALVFFLWCLGGVLTYSQKRWFFGGVLALFAYYHVRAAPQLIFFWTLGWSLLFSAIFLDKSVTKRLGLFWLACLVTVLPWFFRKLITFGSPFFTHGSGMLWTDRSYDNWDFHETIPLPTRESYFATHTIEDFLEKIFVYGPTTVYDRFDHFTEGPFWIYIILFAFAAAGILFLIKDEKKKVVFLTMWVILIGYCGIYNLAPIAHTRHYIPPYFIILFTIAGFPFMFISRLLQKRNYRVVCNILVATALTVAIYSLQKDFWHIFQKKYLIYSYKTSDQRLESDSLVQYLKENLSKDDVILAPFAQGQYLAFATGLTFIEKPANFNKLNEPVEFFRKYNIRYSLVDVKDILPDEMIENKEYAGRSVIHTIGKAGKRKSFFETLDFSIQPDLQKTILKGIAERVVYIDAFHGASPKDLTIFRKIDVNAFVYKNNLQTNKEKLFQSGLLVMRYAKNKAELSKNEEEIIKQFIAHGGRILLLCPAWVWTSYEKKPLEDLPYGVIAKNFDLLLTPKYVGQPLQIKNPDFYVKGFERIPGATFSEILYTDADPILVGKNNKAAAVAVQRENAKLIMYSHNNLLTEKISSLPEGLEFTQKVFDWLLTP